MSSTRSGLDAANWRDGGGRGSWRRNAAPHAHRDARRHAPPPRAAAAQHESAAAAVDSAITGSCAHMCPRAEVLERSRTNELSRFERPAPHMRSPQRGSLDVFGLAVKKYRRPAAGRLEVDVTQLRPPRVLLETLAHLFMDVLVWPGCGFAWHAPDGHEDDARGNASEFLALYHFISDRVRSVRQDLTIQRIEDDVAVRALEQIVRFHVLASLRARQLLPSGHEHAEWSEQLNDQQLASALAQLHVLYHKHDALDQDTNGEPSEAQSEFVAYDILLHADDPQAISLMLLQVPERVRRSPAVKRALALFVALQVQDLHSFFRLFPTASPLEKGLLLKHLPAMWTSSIGIMNKAFGKQDRFPLDEFAKWLCLPGSFEAQMLCNAMNLHLESTQQLETTPSIPKTVESWEDGDAVALEPPVVPPVGFVRFKLAPLNAESDRALTQRLLVAMAKRIQRLEIEEQHQSANDLVTRPGLSRTVKQAGSE